MLNKKGFSLIESLVALFVLSMVTVVFFNSSKIFFDSQTELVQSDRRDQIADLILQDIMEYGSHRNDALGTITVDGNQNFDGDSDSINMTGFTTPPTVGDIFLIEGVRGRYAIESITGTGVNRTIVARTNFPNVSVTDETGITFIALKKQELECFDGLNLNANAPSGIGNCTTLPTDVTELHNHWKTQIDNELGSGITVRNIEVTNNKLVKVTLGDGVNNSTLAKKVNSCIFDTTPNTVSFTFPGLPEPIETGIIEHYENPTQHYFANGVARKFNNLLSDTGEMNDTPSPDCTQINGSTCRQSYASEDAISTFLYRYTGPDVRVKPSNCDSSLGWQCPGVRVNQDDLSLWFIFDEFNDSDSSNDLSNLGYVKNGSNGRGYLKYEVRNLPNNARILTFDDTGESCNDNILNGTCRGEYAWDEDEHDGLVLHLGTSNLESLQDIELEITGVPMGVNKWRVLKPNNANCLIGSGAPDSLHGVAKNQEDPNACWNYVEADYTTTTQPISASSTTSLQVVDSSMFSSNGNMQIGSEFVRYTSNDTSTNTLSGLSRGIRQTGRLDSNITASATMTPADGYKKTLTNQNTQIGFWGGYVKIDDNEIFKVDYCGDCPGIGFSDMDGNRIRFIDRAQKNTSAASHNSNSTVRNHDMEPRNWPAGTRVWESPTHSMPVVQSETNGRFERVRFKRRVTISLSTSTVCS